MNMKKRDKEAQKTTLYLDKELYQELQHFAIDQGKSVSEIVDELIRKVLKK